MLVLAIREHYYQTREGCHFIVCKHNIKSRQNMENHKEACSNRGMDLPLM